MPAYEITTEPISESALGRPVVVTSNISTLADPLHTITFTDAIDCVWLYATNNSISDVIVKIVINPADDTVSGDVDDAALTVTLPGSSTLLILDGARVRLGLASYTIGAYISGAGTASFLGHVVRKTYAEVTA